MGECGPGEEVVGAEGDGLESAADGFLEVAGFHEGHAEGVPAVEEGGVELDAAAVEDDGLVHFAKGEVAVGFVEEGVEVGVGGHYLRPGYSTLAASVRAAIQAMKAMVSFWLTVLLSSESMRAVAFSSLTTSRLATWRMKMRSDSMMFSAREPGSVLLAAWKRPAGSFSAFGWWEVVIFSREWVSSMPASLAASAKDLPAARASLILVAASSAAVFMASAAFSAMYWARASSRASS